MLRKRCLKNKVRVTFMAPADAGEESVHLVGDFNDWDTRATPMVRNGNGVWEVRLDLPPDRRYQYRYLADGGTWRNDPAADDYVPNPFESDNSVVTTAVIRRPRRSGPQASAAEAGQYRG